MHEEATKFLVNKKIQIKQSNTETAYDGEMNTIFVTQEQLKPGTLAHEVGHALVDKNNLYENEELATIMRNVVANAKYKVIKKDDEYYLSLSSEKFIRKYQGRTYINVTKKYNNLKKRGALESRIDRLYKTRRICQCRIRNICKQSSIAI